MFVSEGERKRMTGDEGSEEIFLLNRKKRNNLLMESSKILDELLTDHDSVSP